ncbi:MAG TPA: ATP-binding protein [Albitalea sp.]|nr:ATP-binding protein [Albitalea sp.]
MKLLPRSLFSRNLLLIVGLILVGQVASALLFRQLVMRPRIQPMAEATVRNFESLEEGLRVLPRPQRQQFVERFNARSGKRAGEPVGDRLTLLERAFVRQVDERLAGRGGDVIWRRDSDRSLAVAFAIDGERYWLNVPGLIPSREVPWTWLAGMGATMLLALFGAWLIQRRINRPLNELVHAASALGQGVRPAPLREDGPSEIATVAHGFNDMVAGLANNEQERALMLAGLSHDLRTPLAKMRLATEMLDGRGDAELLTSLNRNIDAMDSLLTQFLDFTRATSSGSWDQEAPATTDLNVLARDALALCAQDPDGMGGVALQAASLPPLPLCAQAVRRLILNLVVNAQRHGAPPIEVATGQVAGSVWLEVRDRGPGIPAHRAEALKKPFVRGDAARSGPAGAGLGLAIVERIARDHGARFDLLPREGGGLAARVEWPAGPWSPQ